MKSLYVETSIVSYLTARPSSDIISAAHQLTTNDWWLKRRHEFNLVTSELVHEEAERGDSEAASRRLLALDGISLIQVTPAATKLASGIVEAHFLPPRAFADALHIATAAIHRIDYLLTWNCAHIANAERLPKVSEFIERAGLEMPFVCTPEELMGD